MEATSRPAVARSASSSPASAIAWRKSDSAARRPSSYERTRARLTRACARSARWSPAGPPPAASGHAGRRRTGRGERRVHHAPPGRRPPRRREPDGALVESGRRRRGTASAPSRRFLEGPRDALVGARGCQRQMPRALLGLGDGRAGTSVEVAPRRCSTAAYAPEASNGWTKRTRPSPTGITAPARPRLTTAAFTRHLSASPTVGRASAAAATSARRAAAERAWRRSRTSGRASRAAARPARAGWLPPGQAPASSSAKNGLPPASACRRRGSGAAAAGRVAPRAGAARAPRLSGGSGRRSWRSEVDAGPAERNRRSWLGPSRKRPTGPIAEPPQGEPQDRSQSGVEPLRVVDREHERAELRRASRTPRAPRARRLLVQRLLSARRPAAARSRAPGTDAGKTAHSVEQVAQQVAQGGEGEARLRLGGACASDGSPFAAAAVNAATQTESSPRRPGLGSPGRGAGAGPRRGRDPHAGSLLLFQRGALCSSGPHGRGYLRVRLSSFAGSARRRWRPSPAGTGAGLRLAQLRDRVVDALRRLELVQAADLGRRLRGAFCTVRVMSADASLSRRSAHLRS